MKGKNSLAASSSGMGQVLQPFFLWEKGGFHVFRQVMPTLRYALLLSRRASVLSAVQARPTKGLFVFSNVRRAFSPPSLEKTSHTFVVVFFRILHCRTPCQPAWAKGTEGALRDTFLMTTGQR